MERNPFVFYFPTSPIMSILLILSKTFLILLTTLRKNLMQVEVAEAF